MCYFKQIELSSVARSTGHWLLLSLKQPVSAPATFGQKTTEITVPREACSGKARRQLRASSAATRISSRTNSELDRAGRIGNFSTARKLRQFLRPEHEPHRRCRSIVFSARARERDAKRAGDLPPAKFLSVDGQKAPNVQAPA